MAEKSYMDVLVRVPENGNSSCGRFGHRDLANGTRTKENNE